MSRNWTFVLVNVTMLWKLPMIFPPDIGSWTVPISWICLFLWIWIKERVFKDDRSSINDILLHPMQKIRFLKFSKIKKNLFPRQEVNLNGGMILKLLSNTGIGLMILQNGISAFEKALLSKNTWYQRFELERTFQNPNEHHFVPRMNAQIVRAINNIL